MLLNEFRIAHSTLIEHYQFIEAHLEGIYAAISGKSLREGLRDVERDSLSGVVREIRGMEKEKQIKVFDAGECAQLDNIIERRNFWCHSCYYDMVFGCNIWHNVVSLSAMNHSCYYEDHFTFQAEQLSTYRKERVIYGN